MPILLPGKKHRAEYHYPPPQPPRFRTWRLIVRGSSSSSPSTAPSKVRYLARTASQVWVVFKNPVRAKSCISLFPDSAEIQPVSTTCLLQELGRVTGGLDQEYGIRPVGLSTGHLRRQRKERKLKTRDGQCGGVVVICPPSSPPDQSMKAGGGGGMPSQRQALLKVLSKSNKAKAATGCGEGQDPGPQLLQQVDTSVAKLQEGVQVLVEATYDTMLKMAQQAAAAGAHASAAEVAASAQSEALRECQKIQGDLETMKSKASLQEACIAKQRKQINILRSGLVEIREALYTVKENIPADMLQHADVLLAQVAVVGGGGGSGTSSSSITNKQAMQELQNCVREKEVAEQILRCINTLHAEVKKLKEERKAAKGECIIKKQRVH